MHQGVIVDPGAPFKAKGIVTHASGNRVAWSCGSSGTGKEGFKCSWRFVECNAVIVVWILMLWVVAAPEAYCRMIMAMIVRFY
jgi:hypothetical protein